MFSLNKLLLLPVRQSAWCDPSMQWAKKTHLFDVKPRSLIIANAKVMYLGGHTPHTTHNTQRTTRNFIWYNKFKNVVFLIATSIIICTIYLTVWLVWWVNACNFPNRVDPGLRYLMQNLYQWYGQHWEQIQLGLVKNRTNMTIYCIWHRRQTLIELLPNKRQHIPQHIHAHKSALRAHSCDKGLKNAKPVFQRSSIDNGVLWVEFKVIQ